MAILVVLVIGTLVVSAFAVAKGRWWLVPIFPAGVASLMVAFTHEPSESFQDTVTFKVLEASMNLLIFGALGAFIYLVVEKPRPGSWWAERYPPSPKPDREPDSTT